MVKFERDEPASAHIADATGSGGADDQKAQINAILAALEAAGILETA